VVTANLSSELPVGGSLLFVTSPDMGKKGRLCVLCGESRTPALSAAMVGHVDCLQEAYKSFSVLNERDRFGATPIHYAARHGQLECLMWLVENSNVSPNAAARNGSTPAHDAAATGNVECLRYLLDNTKCSTLERTIEGATVLHMACRFGRVHAVRWLIDNAGASPSDKGANDVTPVHLCAAKSKPRPFCRTLVRSF
jgi:ankyrin repeat protein